MAEFLEQWGYLAVFLATTIEGEVAYLSAIVAAKLGHMGVIGVAIAGFFGGMTRDSLIFYGARYGGKKFLAKRPHLIERVKVASHWVSTRPLYFLAIHRYIYGFSTATIIVLAMSHITRLRFLIITIVACLTWVIGYGLLGYFAAEQVLNNLDWIKANFLYIFIGLSILAYIIYLIKNSRQK